MRERIGAWSSKLGVCGKREQMGWMGRSESGKFVGFGGSEGVDLVYIYIYGGERDRERERHDLRK